MTRKELAVRLGSSVRSLNRWIKPIMAKLEEAGYTHGQKIFTPKQVKIILEHLE